MRELFNRVFKKEEGFSLIELIIVIAILAIIAAIAVPTLLGNIDKANKSTDISNAKLIADAVATSIAQDPTLEGIAVGEVFATGGGTVVTAAITNLNNKVPTIKSKSHGTPGTNFFVTLTSSTGAIRINATTSTGAILFPQ